MQRRGLIESRLALSDQDLADTLIAEGKLDKPSSPAIFNAIALNNAIVDVWLMYTTGIVGFLFRQANIPLGPLGTWLVSWSHDGSQPAACPDPESRRLDEHPHTPDCAVLPVGNIFHTLVATFAKKSAHTVTSSHFQVTI